MEKEPNLFWQLQNNANFWLKERPTLFERQSKNPQDIIGYLHQELDELLEAIEAPLERKDVLSEITDVANYVAQLVYFIQVLYGLSDEEILGEALFKYQLRNSYRYPQELFQSGDAKQARQTAQGMKAYREKYFSDEMLGAMTDDESGVY